MSAGFCRQTGPQTAPANKCVETGHTLAGLVVDCFGANELSAVLMGWGFQHCCACCFDGHRGRIVLCPPRPPPLSPPPPQIQCQCQRPPHPSTQPQPPSNTSYPTGWLTIFCGVSGLTLTTFAALNSGRSASRCAAFSASTKLGMRWCTGRGNLHPQQPQTDMQGLHGVASAASCWGAVRDRECTGS